MNTRCGCTSQRITINNTWVGTGHGLVIFNSSQAVVGGPYNGTDLGTANATIRINDGAIGASVAFIATTNGLVSCQIASGALSACALAASDQYLSVAQSAAASILAAGRDGGLFLAQLTSGSVSSSLLFNDGNSNLPSNTVNDVVIDGTTVYAATDNGICVVNDVASAIASPHTLCSSIVTQDNSLLPASAINALAVGSGGDLWLGTSQGVVWYDPSTGAMIIYDHDSGLPSSTVLALFYDANGILWIGTENGLSRFDPALGTFTNFTSADWGGSSSHVLSVFVDASSTVWIGTDAGIFAYVGG